MRSCLILAKNSPNTKRSTSLLSFVLLFLNITNHTGIDFVESAVYPIAIAGRNNRLADMSFFTFLTVKAIAIDPRTPKRGLSLKFLPRITQSCPP